MKKGMFWLLWIVFCVVLVSGGLYALDRFLDDGVNIIQGSREHANEVHAIRPVLQED